MNTEELFLFLIGSGKNTEKKIRFELNFKPNELENMVNRLSRNGYIKINDSSFSLTSSGLLKASTLYKFKKKDISYVPKENIFKYENSINKDVIFLPYLEIDARENSISYDSYSLYRTEFEIKNPDFNVLSSIENLIIDISLSSMGLFWIFKGKENFCGMQVSNLIKCVENVGEGSFQIKTAFSDPSHVMIIEIHGKDKKIVKMSLIFYISNVGNWSYVDLIKRINKKLKIVLNFSDMDSIPRGKKVMVGKKNLFGHSKDENDKYNLDPSFILDVLGRICVTDNMIKKMSNTPMPLIACISPKNIKFSYPIKKISPWFIQCSGGFMDEDYKAGKSFRFFHVENWNFPELMIVQIVVVPFFKEDILYKLIDKNM